MRFHSRFCAVMFVLALVWPDDCLVAQQVVPQMLSPEMQQRDFELLHSTLKSMHPGMHRYVSEETLSNARRTLELRLREPRSPIEFFRLVAPYVAKLRCGHTSLEPPTPFIRQLERAENLFPLRLRRHDDRWWVLKDLSDSAGIPPGSELLAINGRAMSEIEKLLWPAMSTDGFNETGPRLNLQRLFAVYFAMHVGFSSDDLELDFRHPGGEQRRRKIRGVRWETVLADVFPESDPFRCVSLDDRHALIDVRYFGATGFGSFLESTFREIKKKRVSTVTLDLRANGGGADNDGALLCTYLIDQPFGYFERIEVTPSYADDYPDEDTQRDDRARHIVTSPKGLAKQTPADNAFSGRVFVLIDGGTFSTAADVASVLYSNRVGTFVGEESGGGFDGNSSGVTYALELPHSKMDIDIPRWMYSTSIGPRESTLGRGRGVPVSYEVQATIAQQLRGEDPVLEKVQELIRQQPSGR